MEDEIKKTNKPNKLKSSDIEKKVYDCLYFAEPYSIWTATRIQKETRIPTFNSVIHALLKLQYSGKLDDIIVIDQIGKYTIYVRKQVK